jgi:ABC-type phosphate/phosphonate transport system substrate-binding protein
MSLHPSASGKPLRLVLVWTAFVATALATAGRAARAEELLIGSSGTLADVGASKEKAALDTLKAFIKDETGMDNQILSQKNWRELGEKMTKGKLQIGVFQGIEFAWAQEKFPSVKPLALGINLYRYPKVYVVTKKDSPIKDFAGLKGKSISLPGAHTPMWMFVAHECKVNGKDIKSFFSKVTDQKNVEDALDDVVDGLMTATAVDGGTLQAYKLRKPGRFNLLRPIAQSQPLPPTVIAFSESGLSAETRTKFRDSLIGAARKERGKTMLTLFHLTGFEAIPADFNKVLASTRKTFPPPAAGTTATTTSTKE